MKSRLPGIVNGGRCEAPPHRRLPRVHHALPGESTRSRLLALATAHSLTACASYRVPVWTNPTKTPEQKEQDAACRVSGSAAAGSAGDVAASNVAYSTTYDCMISKGWKDSGTP